MIVWEWLSLLLSDLVAFAAWSCWLLLIVAVLASKLFLKRRVSEAAAESEPTCGNCALTCRSRREAATWSSYG